MISSSLPWYCKWQDFILFIFKQYSTAPMYHIFNIFIRWWTPKILPSPKSPYYYMLHFLYSFGWFHISNAYASADISLTYWFHFFWIYSQK
jgi:hypothetical protein